jgi:hypothetical protein
VAASVGGRWEDGVMVYRPVDGEVSVHYGQIYVESRDEDSVDLHDCFAGQTSGLCGAAVPGMLFLITGLHTGDVGFTIEVHDRAPAVDPAWEDVVEVSYRPRSTDVCLNEWGGEASYPLGLEETDYRVRYCAQGMDRGNELDTRIDEPQADRYLLQFWPAPPGPDRVLRQTASVAAYWHGVARGVPASRIAERAEAERRARAEEERAERERRLELERSEWGGRLPSETLRALEGGASDLLRFDAALVHALDAAGPEIQRAVALLAARRASAVAGLADLAWVAPALTALAEGRPLPAPFDDWDRMWQTLRSDPRAPDGLVGEAIPPSTHSTGLVMIHGTHLSHTAPAERPGPDRRISQPHMALPAVFHAGGSDPLRAAVDAVTAAVHAYGEDHPTLLQEVRAACMPGLNAAGARL